MHRDRGGGFVFRSRDLSRETSTTFLGVIMQLPIHASLRVFRVLAFVLLGLGAASLQAQTFRGGINGTVTDQSGSVVPGAVVTATNNGTGVSLSAVTSSGGEYQFQD